MRTKGLMGVFGLLIIMLLVLGVAYAHWSDTVTITGTAYMGEFIVGILENSVSVIETTNGVPEDQFTPSKPWVANTTVTLDEPETSVHHDGETVYKKMIITIENAYPGYDVHINFTIKNAGTIPAKAKLPVWEGYDKEGDPLSFRWETPVYDENKECWIVRGYIVHDGEDIVELYYEWCAPEDEQLEPCTGYPLRLKITFLQDADECQTYTVTVTWEFVQWNADS